MKDLIKIWDDELIERNIGIEINYLRDFFNGKDITKHFKLVLLINQLM